MSGYDSNDASFTSLPFKVYCAYTFPSSTFCSFSLSSIQKPKSFASVKALMQYVRFLFSKEVREVPVIWIDVQTKNLSLRHQVWKEMTQFYAPMDGGKTMVEEGAVLSFCSSLHTPASPASASFQSMQPPVIPVTLSEDNLREVLDPCDTDVLELVGHSTSAGRIVVEGCPCIRGVVSCIEDVEQQKRGATFPNGSRSAAAETWDDHKMHMTVEEERGYHDGGGSGEWRSSTAMMEESRRCGESPTTLADLNDGFTYQGEEEEGRNDILYPGHTKESVEEEDDMQNSNSYKESRMFTISHVPPWCSFVASRRVLLTFHEVAFVGLQLLQQTLSSLSVAAGAACGGGVGEDVNGTFSATPHHRRGGRASLSTVLPSTASLLGKLICVTSEARLGDPTSLLSEVDCLDEMVLLIAPGDQDQPDLLRRVALLRRRISTDRSTMYLKEKLLHSFMATSVRTAITSSLQEDQLIAGEVRKALKIIIQMGDRLDDARDTLNQANLNFVTGVSMRISQSSSNMDFKMQVLSQVAVICLPLNLVASIFGMNCTIPFLNSSYPSLTTFWVIIALMVGWCFVCMIPTIRSVIRGNRQKAIVPTD